MNLDAVIIRFRENAGAFGSLLAGVTEEQAHWKPAGKRWSIVEIVNHLFDEERDDFRRRIDLTLHHPGESWPGIDPEGWVTERSYNERGLEESFTDFMTERERSLRWLASLESPDWSRSYDHPSLGVLAAGDLLSSWIAHDFLHLRQLAKAHYDWFEEMSKPHGPAYAGGW